MYSRSRRSSSSILSASSFFPHPLRPNEEEVVAGDEVEHEVAQNRRVPRGIEVDALRHLLGPIGRHDTADAAAVADRHDLRPIWF